MCIVSAILELGSSSAGLICVPVVSLGLVDVSFFPLSHDASIKKIAPTKRIFFMCFILGLMINGNAALILKSNFLAIEKNAIKMEIYLFSFLNLRCSLLN